MNKRITNPHPCFPAKNQASALAVIKGSRELMTARQVAAYLAVSRHTVYQWISTTTIGFPYYKLPRGVRFDRLEVDKWLESRKIAPVDSF